MGAATEASQLDGRRVVVQLRAGADEETGGAFTLKRLKIAKLDENGAAREVSLAPDNRTFRARTLSDAEADVRIVAELLEVLR